MSEAAQEVSDTGLEYQDSQNYLVENSNDVLPAGNIEVKKSKQEQILSFLRELRQQEASSSSKITSEVLAGRVSAVNEIISPQIITDILYAKKIKADKIEGLEILTDKISSLQGQVAGLSTQSKDE